MMVGVILMHTWCVTNWAILMLLYLTMVHSMDKAGDQYGWARLTVNDWNHGCSTVPLEGGM